LQEARDNIASNNGDSTLNYNNYNNYKWDSASGDGDSSVDEGLALETYQKNNEANGSQNNFNAASFLFVSHRVADQYVNR